MPPEDDPLKVAFPPGLDTPTFSAMWSEWIAYRREGRMSIRARTLRKQLDLLAAMSEPRAIEAIESSIRNGWKGLFEPKPDRKPATKLYTGPALFAAQDQKEASA